jgi:hypothetical protein
MITESPPGNGTGARQGAGPGNENNGDQALLDSWPIRKLIKSKPGRGLAFFAVLGRRNRVDYEIVSPSKTWRFPLFFSADSKWDRLIRSEGERP